MGITSIKLAEELARLSAATIFELRGEWRRGSIGRRRRCGSPAIS
jgi:hypothetical protein